jgi:hypothetical protein
MNHARYCLPSKQEHLLSNDEAALLTQSLISIYRVCLVQDHSVVWNRFGLWGFLKAGALICKNEHGHKK